MPDQSSAASVHRRHELDRPAAAFSSIFRSQPGSDSVLLGGKRFGEIRSLLRDLDL